MRPVSWDCCHGVFSTLPLPYPGLLGHQIKLVSSPSSSTFSWFLALYHLSSSEISLFICVFSSFYLFSLKWKLPIWGTLSVLFTAEVLKILLGSSGIQNTVIEWIMNINKFCKMLQKSVNCYWRQRYISLQMPKKQTRFKHFSPVQWTCKMPYQEPALRLAYSVPGCVFSTWL